MSMDWEGAIAAVLLLCALLKSWRPPPAPVNVSRWGLTGVVVVTIVAHVPVLTAPFVSDDYVLLSMPLNFDNLLHSLNMPGADRFFRPLGYVYLGLVRAWADHDTVRWHLASLSVHTANALLIWRLGCDLFDESAAALFAASLFAVHGIQAEAVNWMAASFDVICTALVLAGIIAAMREGALYLAIACLCQGAALACKEMGYALPLLALILLAHRIGMTRAIRKTALLFAIAAIFLVHRLILYQGLGGCTGAIFRPVPTAKIAGLRIWAALMVPVNWSQVPESWLLASLILALGTFVAALAASRGSKLSVVLSISCIAALLPAMPLALIGRDLTNARLYYMSSAFFCLLLSSIWRSVQGQWQRAALAVALPLYLGAALVHNDLIWSRTARLASRTCNELARAGRVDSAVPSSVDGVPFFRNGLKECIQQVRERDAIQRR